MIYEECPHGRHEGAYCEPCEEAKLECDLCGDPECPEPMLPPVVSRQSGLNASYYDFPVDKDGHVTIRNAQDMIEWLDLNFSNGNILKSLIRENNPISQKDTNELYEAEKRYYYAHRHLRSVQERWAAGGVDSADVEKGLENKTKE